VKCLGVTSFTSTVLPDGSKQATFSGPATVNGVTTTYQITVTDAGEPGVGVDSFSIQTGTGFSRSGALTSGNIQIRG
jgi:hypothetical protein